MLKLSKSEVFMTNEVSKIYTDIAELLNTETKYLESQND